MPKGEQTKSPLCKVCAESHWSYEGHKLGIIDAKAKVIEKITKPAVAAPVKRKGRPRKI